MYLVIRVAFAAALLIFLTTPDGYAQPTITTRIPNRNANTASPNTSIVTAFSQNMNAGTASANAIKVFGSQTGYRSSASGFLGGGTSVITAAPTLPFKPGEVVSVTAVGANVQNTSNVPMAASQVWQFRTRAGVGPGNFIPTTIQPTTHMNMWSIVCGDFNGDAYLDVAVTSIVVSQGIEIFVGNASGGYTSLGNIGAGTNYCGLEVADMNNDDRLDIIAASYGAPCTIDVFTNNGAAVFTPVTPVSTGLQSTQVEIAIADMDGDGDLDIFAVADVTGFGGYAICTNAGTGVLTLSSSSAFGNGLGAAAGDIDNDGDIDLAYTDFIAGQVYTLVNNGAGSFSGGQTFSIGTQAYSVRLADINNDGLLDLIAIQTNAGASNLHVFVNTGSVATPFPAAPTQVVALGGVGTLVGKIIVFDANGDGFLDIAGTGNLSGSSVFTLTNNAGSFGPPVIAPVPINPNTIAAADMDGDGDLDFAVTNGGSTTFTILKNALPQTVQNNTHPFTASIPVVPARNTNTAPLATTLTIPFAQPVSPPSVNALTVRVHGSMTGTRTATYSAATATATVTPTRPFRSGEQVFVTVTNAQSAAPNLIPTRPFVYGFKARTSVGPAQFQLNRVLSSGSSSVPNGVFCADFDGDGRADVAASSEDPATGLTVFRQTSPLEFTSQTLGSAYQRTCVAGGDFDNDGDIDLVVGSLGSNIITVYQNSGGTFATGVNVPIPAISSPVSIITADVNGDGWIDIITGNLGGQISILRNQGNGTFPVGLINSHSAGAPSPRSVTAADFDGDGDIDIALVNEVAPMQAGVFLNDGDGRFIAGLSYSVALPNTGLWVEAADILGNDGLPELVVAGGTVGVFVVRNMGGTLSGITTIATGLVSTRSVRVADFNGDGQLDVAASDAGGFQVAVMLGTGSGFGTARLFDVGASAPYAVGSADFDGDGVIDVVTANYGSQNLSLLINAAPPLMTGFTPTRNTSAAAANTAITLTYDQVMRAVTASESSFKVWGQLTGYRSRAGIFAQPSSQQAQLTPARPFRAGELVWVTSTNAQSAAGVAARPLAYGFRTKPVLGTASFLEVARANNAGAAVKPLTGDFNGDGAVDVATANGSSIVVWFNPGSPLLPAAPSQVLTVSNSFFDSVNVQCLYATDVNNDGLLDLLFATGGGGVGLALNSGGSLGSPTALAGRMMIPEVIAKIINSNGETAAAVAGAWIDGADFNADGWQDLVVCLNAPTGAAFVIMNMGNGSFVPNPIPLSGSFTTLVQTLVGDFDNDGDIDIGVVDKGAGAIQLFANDGLGYYFTPSAMIPFANAARAFVADFTGDGRLDIAATSDEANARLTVLTNSSTSLAMSFGGGAAQNIGGNAIDLTGGDFNADGLMDILVSGLPFGQRQIYINSGGGGMVLQPRPRGSAANNTVADMDGDGAMDLVVTNADGSVSIEKNSQIFSINALSPPNGVSAANRSMAITQAYNLLPANALLSTSRIRAFGSLTGRLNGTFGLSGNQVRFQPLPTLRPNEQVFVTVTNAQSSTLIAATRATVYSFRAASGLGPATLQLTALVATNGIPRSLCAADFNRDGFTDIATANTTANTVSILTNTGGRLANAATLVVNAPQAVCAADVDADGSADVLVAGQIGTSAALSVFRNASGAATTIVLPMSGSGSGLWAGDLNGDAMLDVVMTSEAANTVTVLLNNGTGGFTSAHTFLVAEPRLVAGGDVDNDGDLDLVIAGSGGTTVWANMLVNASAAPAPFIQVFNLGAASATALACVDVNSDGNLDVIANAGTSSRVFLGSGNGSFSGGSSTALGVVSTAGVIQTDIGDMNGDGTLDAVSIDRSANLAAVAGASLPTGTTTTLTLNPTALVLADMDNDGDLDAVTAHQAGSVAILLNQEPPSITTFTPSSGFEGTSVSIIGLNFTGVQSVFFGGVPARSFVVNSPTSITAVVGTRTSGPITVANGSVSVQSSQTFTIIERLAIESVTPQFVTTGTLVTVTGTRFADVSAVQMGSLAVNNLSIQNSTTLTFTVPPNAMSAAISLASASESVVSTTALIVVQPPTIASVSPRTTGVGFAVTLTGTNFIGPLSLSIGDATVQTFTVQSPTRLVFTVPVGAASSRVRVANIAGTAQSDSTLIILPPPIISGLVNDSTLTTLTIPNTDGTVTTTTVATVQIRGMNFTGATGATIGGVSVSSFAVLSDGSIVVQVPPSVSGIVTVFSPSGLAQAAQPFVFVPVRVPPPPALSITRFSPNIGSTGSTVIIVGQNLANVVAIRFGGVPVQSFNVSSTNVITAILSTGATGTIEVETLTGRATSATPFTFVDIPPMQTRLSQDSLALVAFYLANNGSAWRFQNTPTRWLTTALLETWEGVTVEEFDSEPRVVAFALPERGIEGTLIDALGVMDALRVLNLSGNRFTGDIGAWIGNLIRVQELRIAGTNATQTLPATALTGGLRGHLPNELANLTTLKVLDVSGNQLSGGFPEFLCSFPDLRECSLANNRYNGTLPECLGTLANIEMLNLSGNQFTGTIPPAIGQILSLRDFRAARNQLTGTIPPFGVTSATLRLTTSALANVKSPNGNVNTGALAASLFSLQILDLSQNLLSGSIPASLGNLSSLSTLRLNNNRLTGQIPADIWNATSLRSVYLNANQLTGSIPEAMSRAQLLQTLVLDSNRLTGVVPAGVVGMSLLRSLSLAANRLSSLPNLARLTQLDTLRVQDNALTFESLEPNRTVQVFSYVRQDSVGAGGERVGYVGKRLVIDGTVGGASNQYRWFKRTWVRSDTSANGVFRLQETLLPTQTQSRLVIEEFAASDTADGYYCHITNPTTPDLTLFMRPVRVTPAVVPPAPTDAPVLLFPTRGMTNVPLFTAFEWQLVGDENRYEIQIGRDSAFTSIVAQSTVQTLFAATTASTSVQGLANGTQYWWRARAVNLGGAGTWSEATSGASGRSQHRSFVTVPNNQALAFPLLDFGRVTLTRTGRAYARVTNVTDAALRLEAALPQDAENNFANAEDSVRVFAPRETKFILCTFTPRTTGQKQGAVILRYRVLNASGAAGDLQTQIVQTAFTGRSGPLDVSAVDFQDILVGRTAIATARVLNRGAQPLTLRRATIATLETARVLGLRTSSQGVMTTEQLESQGIVLGASGSGTDTTAIIVQGSSNEVRRLADGLIVVADVDSAQSEVLANARLQTAQDVVISVGVRPSVASMNNVDPGQSVTLELYLHSTNATQLARQLAGAAQPEFIATVRFRGQVLALDPRSDAYLARNAGGAFTRAVLATRWDTRDTVLGRIQCLAVQGDTDRTELQIESLFWGTRSTVANTGLLAQRVFVDSLVSGVFSSELCRIGGKRLVRQTTKTFLVAARPNPTDETTLLSYALRESGMIEIKLVDAKGSVVKTLFKGLHDAGEYEFSVSLRDVSQGAYMLILSTPTEILHERLSVVR
jgi:Leucine-rich repeat (LRR) protein